MGDSVTAGTGVHGTELPSPLALGSANPCSILGDSVFGSRSINKNKAVYRMGGFDSVVYKIRSGPEMTRDSFDPPFVNT